MIKTHYLYKVYGDGEYLGQLTKYVKSEFEEVLKINTPGNAINLELDLSPDDTTSEMGNILSEAGEELLSEAGEEILYQEQTAPFGSGTLIEVNNDVKIIEISENDPNGVQVFEGYISIVKPNFGGSESMTVTCLSYGTDMDNIIIESGESLYLEQASQSSSYGFGSVHNYDVQAVAQTFEITETIIVSKFSINMRVTSAALPIDFYLLSGDNPNSPGSQLASVTKTISNTSLENIDYVMATPVVLTPGFYTWILDSREPSYGTTQFYVGTAGSNVLSGGSFWTAFDVSHTYVYSSASDDATFKIYETSGSTTATYTSEDPSDILRSIVLDQSLRGGRMSYSVGSIEDTNQTASYTFKVNTTLEGAKKVRELGPSDWHWYGDPATSLVHYHDKATTPHHIFVKGVHINELDLEYTLENIKTVVYFSGGDIGGGVNLYKKYVNSDGVDLYGVRLERVSDNRVTLESTADLIAQDILDNNGTPAYRTKVTIPASLYNIRSFNLGQMVAFRNFQNRNIDSLLLQIVEIRRNADRAILSLDTVPPRASRRVEDIRRNLDKLQTLNNPDTPTT